jgi:hypothetical protein
LSFQRIEYEIVEHKLTAEQIRIDDAPADAFQIIHKNITAALEAANIAGADGGTRNPNAKAAARSLSDGRCRPLSARTSWKPASRAWNAGGPRRASVSRSFWG